MTNSNYRREDLRKECVDAKGLTAQNRSTDGAAPPSITVQCERVRFQVNTEGKQRRASLRGRQADLRGCRGFQQALGPTGGGTKTEEPPAKHQMAQKQRPSWPVVARFWPDLPGKNGGKTVALAPGRPAAQAGRQPLVCPPSHRDH